MKTAIVDTNVILRYLTQDVTKQAKRVARRFVQAQQGKIRLVLLPITVVEIVFQLTHWYNMGRFEAVNHVKLLLSFPWLEVDHKDRVLHALTLYAESSMDFVDVLTWTLAQTTDAFVLSFDRDFDKLEPKIRLEP